MVEASVINIGDYRGASLPETGMGLISGVGDLVKMGIKIKGEKVTITNNEDTTPWVKEKRHVISDINRFCKSSGVSKEDLIKDLNAFKDALRNKSKSRFNLDNVIKLLRRKGVSLEQISGFTKYLNGDEAIDALLISLGENPSDYEKPVVVNKPKPVNTPKPAPKPVHPEFIARVSKYPLELLTAMANDKELLAMVQGNKDLQNAIGRRLQELGKSVKPFQSYIPKPHYSPEQLRLAKELVGFKGDKNRNGRIDSNECAYQEKAKAIDSNGDGRLSRKELDAMSGWVTRWGNIMYRGDANRYDKSLQEFAAKTWDNIDYRELEASGNKIEEGLTAQLGNGNITKDALSSALDALGYQRIKPEVLAYAAAHKGVTVNHLVSFALRCVLQMNAGEVDSANELMASLTTKSTLSYKLLKEVERAEKSARNRYSTDELAGSSELINEFVYKPLNDLKAKGKYVQFFELYKKSLRDYPFAVNDQRVISLCYEAYLATNTYARAYAKAVQINEQKEAKIDALFNKMLQNEAYAEMLPLLAKNKDISNRETWAKRLIDACLKSGTRYSRSVARSALKLNLIDENFMPGPDQDRYWAGDKNGKEFVERAARELKIDDSVVEARKLVSVYKQGDGNRSNQWSWQPVTAVSPKAVNTAIDKLEQMLKGEASRYSAETRAYARLALAECYLAQAKQLHGIEDETKDVLWLKDPRRRNKVVKLRLPREGMAITARITAARHFRVAYREYMKLSNPASPNDNSAYYREQAIAANTKIGEMAYHFFPSGLHKKNQGEGLAVYKQVTIALLGEIESKSLIIDKYDRNKRETPINSISYKITYSTFRRKNRGTPVISLKKDEQNPFIDPLKQETAPPSEVKAKRIVRRKAPRRGIRVAAANPRIAKPDSSTDTPSARPATPSSKSKNIGTSVQDKDKLPPLEKLEKL